MIKLNNENDKRHLDFGVINSWLFVCAAFFFIPSVALGNVFLFLILVLWLIEGRFAEKFAAVKHNPLVHAILVFVALHFIGLLWTSDWDYAGLMLSKSLKYLLLPVLMTVVRKEHIIYYFMSFLASMVIVALISYGLHWEVIPKYEFLRLRDPSLGMIPFVHHVVYNPMLAITLYLLLYVIFLLDNVPRSLKIAGLVLFVVMGINMFITPGRMGYLVFLSLLTLFIFQLYPKNLFKSSITALLFLITFVPAIYWVSPMVQERVDIAIHEVQSYEDEPNSSIGLRVVMLLNSFEIIKENPLFGVGTGDYMKEYITTTQEHFPEATRILLHPHNVFMHEMVKFGIFGLLSLGYLFYAMLKLYHKSSSQFKPIMLAFPLFNFIIFFSDGYNINHYSTIFFLLLAAVIYRSDTMILKSNVKV